MRWGSSARNILEAIGIPSHGVEGLDKIRLDWTLEAQDRLRRWEQDLHIYVKETSLPSGAFCFFQNPLPRHHGRHQDSANVGYTLKLEAHDLVHHLAMPILKTSWLQMRWHL